MTTAQPKDRTTGSDGAISKSPAVGASEPGAGIGLRGNR
jgi:hypothetical protein